MSIFRSYFSKNSTLIEPNETNNSQNPVTEISYGTLNYDVSRFIFDIDLQPLVDKINSGEIKSNCIDRHILHLTNTIRFRPDLLNENFVDGRTERASSFTLDLFNVDEDWDEGSGYEFIYLSEEYPNAPRQASNWINRQTGISWTNEGAYTSGITGISGTSGSTIVIASQGFEKGNENINIDITDYVNAQIFSGTTGFTATTFGLGLKFTDEIEALITLERQAVGFHGKNTHTFYEPFIETIYDDTILDDRNYFFLDKDNDLYLYSSVGNGKEDVLVSGVTIYDYEDNIVLTVTGSNVMNVSKGVYKITLNIDSSIYPDAVLFTDRWTILQNGKIKTVDQEFYLISQDNYFNFELGNRINPDNYFFSFFGIRENDKIKRGGTKKVILDVKELYPNQDNHIPLDLEYRIYVKQTDTHEIDVISWSPINRTLRGYEFDIDTSWLIPQDYFLEIQLISGNISEKKTPLRFTVVSDGITGA